MTAGRSAGSPASGWLAGPGARSGGAVRLQSRPLPRPLARRVVSRLSRAHGDEPFSAVDARDTVRRVARIVAGLGLEATVFRGAVDLRGAEVDHVWLVVGSSERDSGWVVDVAFPLFVAPFVDALRRFVAGDASADELATAAAMAGLDDRVVGVFPAGTGYLGRPVWSGP
ncbi:MAG TPA: hypothetical protein VML96_09800 [Egibacteraceae bacterium]|nr:hypothetical protein [Egibacteraceae bacterium]